MILAACAAYAEDLYFVFNEKFLFDDNIYLTKNNKKASLISTSRLGLNIQSSIAQTSLDFTAGALIAYNYYFTDAARNSYINSLMFLAIKNESINADNTFRYTSDTPDSSFMERVKRISNSTKFYFKTSRCNLLSFGAGFSNIVDDYLDVNYEDLSRNRINAIADAHYEIFTRADIYLEYTASYIEYVSNKGNNSFGNSIGFGIKGEITPAITANVKLSFNNRNYSKRRILSVIGAASDHYSIFGYEALLKWEPQYNTSFILSGHRKLEETMYYLDRYYISTLGSLCAKRKIYAIVSVSLLFSYEELSYTQSSFSSSYGAKRTDNILRISPGAEIEAGSDSTVAIWYSYNNKSSDKSEVFEFVDSIIGIDFRIKF
jgi:hypothetical protein